MKNKQINNQANFNGNKVTKKKQKQKKEQVFRFHWYTYYPRLIF